MSICERLTPHKAVQHGMIQLGRHNAWPSGCQPNLLLVMPAFGQFAGRVEPIERQLFTRPTEIESGPRKWIKRFMEASRLIARDRHQADQNTWAQTAIHSNSFVIQQVDQCDHVLRRLNVRRFDEHVQQEHPSPTSR